MDVKGFSDQPREQVEKDLHFTDHLEQISTDSGNKDAIIEKGPVEGIQDWTPEEERKIVWDFASTHPRNTCH